MHRYWRGEAFDERAIPDLDPEAIDFRAASESFAEVRKLTHRDLESLRLITSHQGRNVPTVGGVLLFGRDRLAHFPDAWIQAGRFDGTDKSRILDSIDLETPLVEAIQAASGLHRKTLGAWYGDWPSSPHSAMKPASHRSS